ncbi:MAG TPA: TIGR01777 family oxidoreductase [Acidimicrobiales bacterium]|nr:TIGR01777 family oxidoreductase [Acidimicrobiales bacterium]
MTYTHRAVFDHPLDEVFAWHARPGAIHRLVPPWQPVRVASESDSLEHGTAVLAMPGGLRWVATHQPGGYVAGSRFTDVLTTPVLGTAVQWRHTHSFAAVSPTSTEVTDTVDTRVPERFLRAMFEYRTRQLAGDLAAHRAFGDRRLTVAVTGSAGLIGSALSAFLTTGGHTVIRLVRTPSAGTGTRVWDPSDPDPSLLEGVDAVVHLAGASIAGRFTEAHKSEVRESRISPTEKLAARAAASGVQTFVSASAIGYYGADRGDEELDESSSQGRGFLADLVGDWEKSAGAAGASGSRVVMMRTGIVQSPKGGALRLQRLLFELGLGGRLGSGRQWFSWIGIDDMVDAYARAIFDDSLEGPVNAVAPEPVRNAEFTRVLARVLHRPAILPVPSFGPALLLGREGASEVAAASQRVMPAKLEKAGHEWRHPELEPALRHVLGRTS